MNKPVAWMFEYGTDRGDAVNGISWYPNVHFKKPELSGLIRNIEPLYTHPVKEKGLPLSSPSPMNQACLTSNDNYMTDDEIWAVASDYFAVKSHYVTDFARAILRKAQDK